MGGASALRGRLASLVALASLAAAPAQSHDIYNGLKDPAGRLCCGGDPVTGDCEPVEYRMLPNGDALMDSRRYGRSVLVAHDKIIWMAVPGAEEVEAHWCGRPYASSGYHTGEPLQIDQNFYTLCAFIRPGDT
ncbi:hypothetical protein [Alsobacter soli]|uniref:hypothetical protein n=1 Tax=Alsobacter soli TaxID=2109933 RepID=UPI0011B1FECB|nr:hypothetical protein [Alsobacter soli]